MTDPRLQPLLDMIAANIAAAVLAELRAGTPNENPAEAGQPGGVNSSSSKDSDHAIRDAILHPSDRP
jgi:hypothetical protein